MRDLVIRFHENDMTGNGRLLMRAATAQDRHRATLLRPRDGIVHADIAGADSDDSVIRIRVRPRAMGQGENERLWEVPQDIVERVRHGELAGASAWNEMADAFLKWCAAEHVGVVINPDWITMTAAAERLKIRLDLVRQAAACGHLATWEDWRESNPQRRKRVSSHDAEERWGNRPQG